MKYIMEMVKRIDEEINDAQTYAEKYLECKAKDSPFAQRWKEMAGDELRHAQYIHDYAVAEIDKLRKVYTPPVAMQEEWDKAHKEYVERVAVTRQMLTM